MCYYIILLYRQNVQAVHVRSFSAIHLLTAAIIQVSISFVLSTSYTYKDNCVSVGSQSLTDANLTTYAGSCRNVSMIGQHKTNQNVINRNIILIISIANYFV